jgi:hypothetical protein
MLATRESEVGLVDLLDRVLHKGLVLNADIIITVSGIPLVGLNLRAILASVDTMVAYGMWKDWDQAQRAIASEEERHKVMEATRFLQGQTPLYRSFCSCYENSGTIRAWRPGTLYVTDTRVVVNRREPLEILSDSQLGDLAGYAIEDAVTVAGKTTRYIHLLHHDGTVISLHLRDPEGCAGVIQKEMGRHNLPLVKMEHSLYRSTTNGSPHRTAPPIPFARTG